MIAWRQLPAPPGYLREWRAGDTEIVMLREAAPHVREAMRDGTLYAFAAHAPSNRPMAGRGTSYAVTLPDGGPSVVVRHSRHGGLLAALTGDRFVGSTRAPGELRAALRLTRLSVPTPEVVAYATYPAGPMLRRSDVATREVDGGRDLGALLVATAPGSERAAAWAAVVQLLGRMRAAGARHPDLNAANVLLAPDGNGSIEAWLLDVDRVWFDEPGEARGLEANLSRLLRSLRKWRDVRGAMIEEEELETLADKSRSAAA